MTWNKNKGDSEAAKQWGGPWTEKKLEAFSKYVWSYLTIMKNFPYWETIYFDGFVGSGTKEKVKISDLYLQLGITEEEEKTYKGAAERVLDLKDNLSFDFHYFIDKCDKSLEKLKTKLEEKFKDKKMVFRSEDANVQLVELSKALKTKKYAALVLLDPFGMQINWDSFEQLKGTRSDVWVLVPTGVIINRLLDKKGKLKFSKKLESFFGLPIDEIKSYFYNEERINTLFGEEEIVTKVSDPIEKIAKLYAKRLKTIWMHVTDEPLVLRNKNGVPIFHFVFASNNENAKKIAKQIITNI
ncbi:MAG: three-Cys-motif partner protein TcmP [Bacteroidales bacterium]|nr:three-Cys-motif partner protein TcmP [Bacteroidales bacterium]